MSTQLLSVADQLKIEWANIKQSMGKSIKKNFVPACQFLYRAIDVLIISAEENIDASGMDKKSAVIAAFATVLTTVIFPVVPWYIKPFLPKIQYFILAVIVPATIDYVVGVYNKKGGIL